MVVQVLQFDLPPCGSLEDKMLAKCMVSLVRVVIVRVKVIVTAIVTVIVIEKVINYFEEAPLSNVSIGYYPSTCRESLMDTWCDKLL